jgi:hypothetical protein
MTIVSQTCPDDGFFNLLMNMNPFNQRGNSTDRETFICLKHAVLFGLSTQIPIGGGEVSTVMLISDE